MHVAHKGHLFKKMTPLSPLEVHWFIQYFNQYFEKMFYKNPYIYTTMREKNTREPLHVLRALVAAFLKFR